MMMDLNQAFGGFRKKAASKAFSIAVLTCIGAMTICSPVRAEETVTKESASPDSASTASEPVISTTADPSKIKFFYVHGTNMNTEKRREEFLTDATNLHAAVSEEFPKSAAFQNYVLKNGQLSIDPVPFPFFWGFLSAPELTFLEKQLTVTETINTIFAKRVRHLLGFILHDVNWVEQTPNQTLVSTDLQNSVLKNAGKEPVVIFGHSAGSLAVFNYLTYRMPMIELVPFFKTIEAAPQAIAYLEAHPQPPTCLQALLDVQAVRYDSYGRLQPFFKGLEPEAKAALIALGDKYLQHKIDRLNETAKTDCLAPGQFRGLVTLGSPISVFESSIGNRNQSENYLALGLLTYMIEHQIFWLHVNHLNDPIGFSLTTKDLVPKLETLSGQKITPQTGFLYSNNAIKSGANVLTAHGWYWQKPKAYAKVLRESFDKGVTQAVDFKMTEASPAQK